MIRYNENSLMVYPINKIALKDYLKKHIDLKENQDLTIDTEAIIFKEYSKIHLNDECVYRIMERGINKESGKSESFITIGIRRQTKNADGSITFSVRFESYIHIFKSEWKQYNLLEKKISLKEFMGSRFNYNFRIIDNTIRMISHINSLILSEKKKRRKYNASYRLRKMGVSINSKNKTIYLAPNFKENITIKILINEFHYVIQTQLF